MDASDSNDLAGLTVSALLWQEAQAIVAGAIGGARYGVKVRAPHALVMTFLFNKELTTVQKFKKIIQLSAQHAVNLTKFAFLYKVIIAALKAVSRPLKDLEKSKIFRLLGGTIVSTLVNGPLPGESFLVESSHHLGDISHRQQGLTPAGHPQKLHHALVAGAIAGYHVWGEYNGLNLQVLYYLTSRVLVGAYKRYVPVKRNTRFYSLLSALVWGVALMLYEDQPQVLQPSMRSSMDEIYRYTFKSDKTAKMKTK